MGTPHNEAQIGDIAKTVLMPGDPLRAKYIADNYLTDVSCFNTVRNMSGFTGIYNGCRVSVMGSGMGMPSMGIYSYELYKYYGVENIIRIGSCGSYKPELKLFDIILAENVFSEGNFALTLNNEDCHIVSGNYELNKILEETDINLHGLSVVCVSTDVKEYAQYVHIVYGHFLTEDEVRALVTTSTHHHWIDIFSLADYSLCFSQQEKIIDIIQSAMHS